LEYLRTLDYEDVVGDSSECVGDGVNFAVSWEVDENTPEEGTKTVVLTVSWTEKGEAKSYALETVYTAVTA
jgi:hypothetical protein